MKTKSLLTTAAFLFGITAAQADWFPGDDHKMHYPQLPDPDGWDINVHDWTLADDWQCSETGTVSDVHFWVSWEQDMGDPAMITQITLSIHNDIPAGTGGIPWSRPGNQI